MNEAPSTIKPSRTKKIVARVLIGLLVLVAGLLCAVFFVFNPKQPLLYKIANNYKGWAIVKFDDPSCAPLEHEAIFLVIQINSSGLGCSSSPFPEGWRFNRYEYVDGAKMTGEIPASDWGAGGQIWAGFGIPDKHAECFFVGTEHELSQSWSSRPIGAHIEDRRFEAKP
jgi:hypothetical protein